MKDLTLTIVRPHITEKATVTAEKSVYVFQVAKDSTKKDIAKAFSNRYKVTPIKIAVVNQRAKAVVIRGKRGMKPGHKKAYVYLKKGEKVEII